MMPLSGLGGATLMAQLAALGGACSYAVSGLLVRRVDFPPIRFGFFVLGMGAIILITLSLLIQGKPNLDLSLTAGLALLYLGILPTGAGQILRFVLIKKVGYSAFSLSLNLIPVFGVGLGALLLGEIIGPADVHRPGVGSGRPAGFQNGLEKPLRAIPVGRYIIIAEPDYLRFSGQTGWPFPDR